MLKATAHAYRSAYSGLSRSTWLLSLIMLINRSGTMVVPFMTLYLTSAERGYSIGQAGYVVGLFGAGSLAGAWLGGRLTDKIGFYPVQLAALLGGGCLFIALGQMKSYPLICLFTFLVSLVNEAFRPANSTAIAFYSKEENRTRSYSMNRLAINLGWALGGATGGLLAQYDYQLLFWVDGITNLLAAVLMLAFLRKAGRPSAAVKAVKEPAPSPYQDKTYLVFIVLCSLYACCFFQLFTNGPVYFRRELHLSEPVIGLLMALNGLIIVFLEMVLIYSLEKKNRNTVYIVAGMVLTGLSFLLLVIPARGILLPVIMVVLVTFGEILAMPFMNSYWISRTHPSNRGQYAALYTMAWAVAQTIGPAGGAQIAQQFGFIALWCIIGIVPVLAALGIRKWV